MRRQPFTAEKKRGFTFNMITIQLYGLSIGSACALVAGYCYSSPTMMIIGVLLGIIFATKVFMLMKKRYVDI
jgi:F0F1-type ATP synthase assembly protein I